MKTTLHTDYLGNLILQNGKPQMYRFSGVYYSYTSAGVISDCHLYIQDYQGNTRMVVNARTNATEQQTHYYPYGELISDISTGIDLQKLENKMKAINQ